MAISRHNLVPDLPDNNFATLNPLMAPGGVTLANGNLRLSSLPTSYTGCLSNFVVSSGKWYFEGYLTGRTSAAPDFGWSIPEVTKAQLTNFSANNRTGLYGMGSRGNGSNVYAYTNGSESAAKLPRWYAHSEGGESGSVVSVYADFDSGIIRFAKNGVYYADDCNVYFPANTRLIPRISAYGGGYESAVNFGQDPTFDNYKTDYSGGNNSDGSWSDANGIGRFHYEPPAGALALCSRNLQPAVSFTGYDVEETGKALTYNGDVKISKSSPYMGGQTWYTDAASKDAFHFPNSELTSKSEWTLEGFFKFPEMHSKNYLFMGSQSQFWCATGNSWISNSKKLHVSYVSGSSWIHVSTPYDISPHAWYHVAVTKDSNYLYTFFVNGESIGSWTSSKGYSDAISLLSAYYETSSDYTPKTFMSNFRFSDVIRYTVDFDIPTEPFVVDENTISPTFTTVGSPESIATSPYNTPAKQRENALTGFGGGSFDFTNASTEASSNNPTVYTTVTSEMQFGTGDFTMELWYFHTTMAAGVNNWKLLAAFNDYYTSSGIVLYAYEDYLRTWERAPYPTDYNEFWGTSGLSAFKLLTESWNHIRLDRHNNKLRHYLNGTQIGSTLNNTTNFIPAIGSVFNVGRKFSDDGAYPSLGYIADVLVCKESLSQGASSFSLPTEPATATENTVFLAQPYRMKPGVGNMNLKYGNDLSGATLAGSVGSITTSNHVPVEGVGMQSLRFSDSSHTGGISPKHYEFPASVANSLNTNNWTIEFWYKTQSTKEFFSPFGASNGGGNVAKFGMYFANYGNTLNWDCGGGGNAATTSITLESGKIFSWTHIVVMANGSGTSIYIDGERKVNNNLNYSSFGSITSPFRFGTLGENWTACSGASGCISGFRIVNNENLYAEDGDGNLSFDEIKTCDKAPTTGTVLVNCAVGYNTELSAAENPSQHFKTVTYEGTGGDTNAIDTVGFKPDFVWIKKRDGNGSGGAGHIRTNSVTGVDSSLYHGEATAGTNDPHGLLQSFDTSGFTTQKGIDIGAGAPNNLVNDSGSEYVAWTWKAGGAPADNKMMKDGEEFDVPTTGSITPSKMSVNTKAGFSIISYTSNPNSTSGSTDTLPHGLTSAPEMIIVKHLNGTNDWMVWHKDIGSNNLNLNNNSLPFSVGAGGIRIPDQNLINIGGSPAVNSAATAQTYICYAWHSVPGYSSFGVYTGQGDANPSFIYTGFKPAFLMLFEHSWPNRTYATWQIFDNARSPYNTVSENLNADTSQEEGKRQNGDVDTSQLEFLSNGFRGLSGGPTSNGDNIIYMAFAETPLNFANAR